MESRDYIDPNQLALNFPNQTPGEKTEINMEGKNFEININEILLVLKNTSQKYFDPIDYSLLTSPKSLLSHFYYNENECLAKIKAYPYYKRKFYKSLIYESILEIFKQCPDQSLIKEILDNLQKVKNIFNKKEKKNEEIKVEDYYKSLEEIFGTREVPKFLIRDDLKFIKFRENYKFDEKRPEVDNLITYYKKIKNGKIKPFDYISCKSVLFDIFILSNSKDISDNELINNILIDNYKEILSWFNLDIEKKSFDYIYNNFIIISPIEKDVLLETLFISVNNELNNPNNKEDLYLILISSFFYCILHKLIDNKENSINNNDININNSRITKLFTNTTDSLIKYLNKLDYDINSLISELFTYTLGYLNKKEKGGKLDNKINNINNKDDSSLAPNFITPDSKKNLLNTFYKEENIDYDFKMIEEKIMESKDDNLKERFQNIKNKLKLIDSLDSPSTFVETLVKKLVNVFTSNIYYFANFIRLSPFQKYISSNIVTIFVSGFGSQNDVHCIEWKKYIENDTRNSNYYFYHWPGDSFTKIIIKSLPIGLGGIKFDSDLPKVFMDSKNKAKISGKVLSIILRSRLFFGHRQINLVAFSLGNHVVKNCLKELNLNDDGRMIINDVTFMAGATTFKDKIKWYKIFKKLIGGRIVNCYSKKDNILKYLYSNCTGLEPIGSKEIDINDGKGGKNIVENYDFTDLNLGHLDYRDKFKDILNRINNK